MRPVARLRGDFPTKFGIPRQSGLADALEATVVFEPEFRRPEALRGLEGFSHIWLVWLFSGAAREGWSPTVRPPRLGGNRRVGVFASRSPFRPNPIGLSAVRLIGIEHTRDCGAVLRVAGADLMDGTPILDIKPYLPYADARPDAACGFAGEAWGSGLRVDFPEPLLSRVPPDKRAALLCVLAGDPRPAYHEDGRRYGFVFADMEIKFTVRGDTLTVCQVADGSPRLP